MGVFKHMPFPLPKGVKYNLDTGKIIIDTDQPMEQAIKYLKTLPPDLEIEVRGVQVLTVQTALQDVFEGGEE